MKTATLKAAIIVEGQTFTGCSHAEALLKIPHDIDVFDTPIDSGFVTEEGLFLCSEAAFQYAKSNDLLAPATKGELLQSWMLKQ